LRFLAPLGIVRIARFRPDPGEVEHLRLARHVVAAFVELVVPLGVLDDDLDLRVDLPGGLENPFLRDLVHQRQAVLGPGLVPFGLPTRVAGAVGEPEIVNHDDIEEAGGGPKDLLDIFLRGDIRITGNFLPPIGQLPHGGRGHAAFDDKSLLSEPFARGGQNLLWRIVVAPEHLEVHLGDAGLAAPGQSIGQAFLVLQVTIDVLGREQGGETGGSPPDSGRSATNPPPGPDSRTEIRSGSEERSRGGFV
jgi:hypothetical protein